MVLNNQEYFYHFLNDIFENMNCHKKFFIEKFKSKKNQVFKIDLIYQNFFTLLNNVGLLLG